MVETSESALERFRAFVQQNGFPPHLEWLMPEQVTARPGALYVRHIPTLDDRRAREAFETATAQNRGVLFQALFCNDAVTFCHAWLPLNDHESQRYLMPQRGLKMSVPAGEYRPKVYTVSGHIRWLFLRLGYRKYDTLRDLLFNIER